MLTTRDLFPSHPFHFPSSTGLHRLLSFPLFHCHHHRHNDLGFVATTAITYYILYGKCVSTMDFFCEIETLGDTVTQNENIVRLGL